MRLSISVLLISMLMVTSGFAEDPLPASTPLIAEVVDLDRVAETLGDGWRRDRGLVIESEQDIARLQGPEKEYRDDTPEPHKTSRGGRLR